MKSLYLMALVVVAGCTAKKAEPKTAATPPPPVQGNWKNCRVANAVAQQFAHALVTMGQLDHYVNGGTVTFRVCEEESLECNVTPQPFPENCQALLAASPGRKQTALTWSPSGTPPERKAPYALAMVKESGNDVVFSWPMNYQFSGSPTRPDGKPSGVLAGVSESRGGAPTIRVVVHKFNAHETKESAILFGERSVEPQSP